MKKMLNRWVSLTMVIAMITTMFGGYSSAQAAWDPTNDLLLHYKFDASSIQGTSVVDASGNGYDGIIGGDTTPSVMMTEGREAISLDGISQFVKAPSGVLNSLNDFTIAFWAYLDEKQGQFTRFFDFGDTDAGKMYFTETLFLSMDGLPWGENTLNGGDPINVGEWSHVTLSKTGTTYTIYKNGAILQQANIAVKPSDYTESQFVKNYIGKSNWQDPYLKGKISDFRIYNIGLSGEEVAGLAGSNSLSDPNLKLWYQFEEMNGTTVSDSSGHGFDGAYVNTPAWGTGVSGNSFKMTGGASDSSTASYVKIPNGVLEGLNDITVSAWVKWDSEAAYQWLYALGVDTSKYLFFTPKIWNGYPYSAITSNGGGGERGSNLQTAFPTGEWKHVAYSLDSAAQISTVYINGEQAAKNESVTVKPSDLYDVSKDYSGYIGKSFYPDPYFGGEVDDFRIYSIPLTENEVQELYVGGIAAEQAVALAKEKLSIGSTIVNDDVFLPSSFYGTTITWTSSNTAYFNHDGSVTRPAEGQSVAEITLTATIQKANATDTKIFTINVLPVGFSINAGSYNPIIKTDANGDILFTADPAAMVDGDTVYLYVGRDEAAPGTWFYMKEWLAFSSTDMVNWKNEGSILKSADFSWATDASSWAAHMTKRNGKYYFYTTVDRGGGNGNAIGVAVSSSPTGPFEDAIGGPLFDNAITTGAPLASMEDIDPAVFVDDDGQAYLYWGNSIFHYALLNDDMISIKDLNGDGKITEGQDIFTGAPIHNLPGGFGEGAWVHKANGKYYLTFPQELPQKIVYATSDSPRGPWQYQGVIMDGNWGPNGEDVSGTNHPAVIEFKGKTYIIYHNSALPSGDHHRRSVSVEELRYNPDGSIQKSYMSSTGLTGDEMLIRSDRHPDKYIRFKSGSNYLAEFQENELTFKWDIALGLADQVTVDMVSIQAVNKPGYYLGIEGNNVTLTKNDNTTDYKNRTTFRKVPGLADESGVSFQSIIDPNVYLRQSETDGYTIKAGVYSGNSSQEDKQDATFHLVSADGMGEEPTEEGPNPLIKYSFNENSGMTVVNSGTLGAEYNATSSEAITAVEGVNGNALLFDGVTQFVTIPKELSFGNELTISMWVKTLDNSTISMLYNFGNTDDKSKSMWLNQRSAQTQKLAAAMEPAWAAGNVISDASPLPMDSWIHLAIGYNGKSITVYKDGVAVATNTASNQPSDYNGEFLHNYIAKSLWPDPLFKGYMDDFRIYDQTLNQEQIASMSSDRNAVVVAQDTAALTLGDTSAVSRNMELPMLGEAGSFIAWSSSDEAVITNKGIITLHDSEQTAVLTASITKGSETSTKSFTITIPDRVTAALNFLELEAAEMSLPNAENIRGNITLPEKTAAGATITWASDREDVISTVITPNDDYDITPAGVVKRQNSDTHVKLSATLSYEGQSKTKVMTVTVKAATEPIEDNELAGYYYTYFRSNLYGDGESQNIHLATSKDGLFWDDMNNNEPILHATLGTKGVRDSYIIRAPEGDRFYLIGTDLDANLGNWGAYSGNGSKSIYVWQSDDLINWSEPRLIPIAPDNAGNMWAPETIYDPNTGEYIVYFASNLPAGPNDPGHHRILYVKTRDFWTFSEAKTYKHRTPEYSIIDTSMLAFAGNYYRFTKNEKDVTIMLEKSDKPLGEFTLVKEKVADQGSVEGPGIFKLNGQDKFLLYMDGYGARNDGFFPTIAESPEDLDQGNFRALDKTEFRMPTGAKHGSMLPITQEEYDRVMAEWGGSLVQPVTPGTGQVLPDLEYTFDLALSGTTVTNSGKSGAAGNATIHNGATYVADAEKGQVLYLSGGDSETNSPYMRLPENYFVGKDNISVFMDVKTQMNGWDRFYTFSIAKDRQKYLGIRASGGGTYSAITVKSDGFEQMAEYVATPGLHDQWTNVGIVLSRNEDGVHSTLKIYQDGILAAENILLTANLSTMGGVLNAFIGKPVHEGADVPGWVVQQYFKGYIDNVRVYNRALTEEQVAQLGDGGGKPDTGGGIIQQPPITPATDLDKGVVIAKPIIDANGMAQVSLGAETIREAIKQSVGGKLQVKVESSGELNKLKLELPAIELLGGDNGNDIEALEVEAGLASVTISTELIGKHVNKSQANIQLSIERADLSILPVETQKQLENAKVLAFELLINGISVDHFDGRTDVQVAIPYDLSNSEDPDNIIIYFINDNGELDVVTNGKYDAAAGKVVFKPSHFSKYAAIYIDVQFADVLQQWARTPIEALAARGIVQGKGDNRFDPNGNITRAEFVEMLMNLFGLAESGNVVSFTDIKEGAWYYDTIAAAEQLGIIKGKSDGTFAPHEQISREDMAVMAYRAMESAFLKLTAREVPLSFADDNDISPYARESVTLLQGAGIVNGMSNGNFAPKATATRAQAAVIVFNILELV
ncbi:LamG-like jellyroll fold domain-containing protein [Paenibacillus sp. LHD-117]|uniref:LamG-like jellyroll fold domain-containing protein n=1 Tax=Paenibacillus sp. LHD-117 TaxID=3071412 RepID=UPI0027E075E0|nr:LamG-like jellyroll fold domain-containing protein [Paenibacillus sp. LHD-117]MDQ6417890.1 LamG-like jellyroll fold domain-containing protein [Paenibacillus sp. LHD-117]